MFKHIRTSRATKIIACYLAIMLFLEVTQPMAAYALTEGPSQPEFNSFTPISTSDMVDLSTGDFNYNIPIMDVGGYPINLAYNSGVTMDQEASWVGLGWNLNIGQINRNVRGLPDDFKGDEVINENNLRDNLTVGASAYFNFQVIGLLDNVPTPTGLGLSAGLDMRYNNYSGLNVVPSFGASFALTDQVSVGMQLSSSVEDGASVTPSVSISSKKKDSDYLGNMFSGSLSSSVTYNSRQGLQSFNLSASASVTNKADYKKNTNDKSVIGTKKNSWGASSSYSFSNNTFTPTKRLAFKNNSIRYSVSGGADLWGAHIEGSLAGYASLQKLDSKYVAQKSYGYENTDFADQYGLLDFNREKELGSVTRNTVVLPVTNYTYDIYSIQGQGISGTFRPYRGQVGYVYDGLVSDKSASYSAGGEFEGGAGAHVGLNLRTTNTTTYTGIWNTKVIPHLKEKITGNDWNYEKVFFKTVGENRVDKESIDILNFMGKNEPVTLKIDLNKRATNSYRKKLIIDSDSGLTDGTTFFNTNIKRKNRELRNQMIQKLSRFEVNRYGLTSMFSLNSGSASNQIPSHHTAGYIVTGENGVRHVFGDAVYNNLKEEVTFNVGNNSANINQNNGTVSFTSGVDNTSSNSKGRDHYFNKVTTPKYAHTYLLTSVLSPDYSDITGNGVSDDDLGTYTKFEYKKQEGTYKWRIPYKDASYNEGFKTDQLDQKGSYLYGEKETKYISRIITKTHVAYFELENRKDGIGAMNTGLMLRIRSIKLYSKQEIMNENGTLPISSATITVKPIKTAHFEYDYSLCGGIDNNNELAELDNNDVNLNVNKGKLTLKKVYFTYRDSNMGKYTPYKFNYDTLNPDYHVKAYDIWGNYKPFIANSWSITSTNTTPQEFPYVDQSDKSLQDSYASAWSLSSIELPSGGKINIGYESDDYQYVQNKKAMQMFKIHGVTDTDGIQNYSSSTSKDYLYNAAGFNAQYIAIELPQEVQNDNSLSHNDVKRKYTYGLKNQPIYFNFLLNMTSDKFDYVTGYFVMDDEAIVSDSKEFLFIPMKKINREGKLNDSDLFNPISVAGWFFGRQNLNAQVFGKEDPAGNLPPNIISFGHSLVQNLEMVAELVIGANGLLKSKNCARVFKPQKSWIRLLEPSGTKLGGGSRVKTVVLMDEWQTMMNVSSQSDDIERYAKHYGQEYSYVLDDDEHTSSGVATYEPNISKENPLIVPLFHKPEKLTAQSYQEKPFGESFFPAPVVTYSRVTVKNITAKDLEDIDGSLIAASTKTGKVVTQHYTSYDFPTRADYTNLDKSKVFNTNENEVVENMLKSLVGLKIDINTDLTLTQGFVIETNDMNGKLKSQEVYNHSNSLISSVSYVYRTKADDKSQLNNIVTTIDEKGGIKNDLEIATHFDVVNDLRESYNHTNSFGVAVNVDFIPLGFIPIVLGWAKPEQSSHTQVLHTAVTTKVIHRSGILEEKIAYDLGSRVYTKNHAWDAKSGQVILTETVNEFDDAYFSFTYPAYWYHQEMGMTSQNADISGLFDFTGPITEGSNKYFKILGNSTADISKFLRIGDELAINRVAYKRVWVHGYNSIKNAVQLINANGDKVENLSLNLNLNSITNLFNNIPYFRVIRSSFRNQQMASMASVTLMKNPLLNMNGDLKDHISTSFLKTNMFDPMVINASAIEYNQDWLSQCENGLPQPGQTDVNEYLFNIKGLWRPVKSYAYLTGRNIETNANTRNAGFYTSFNPFYSVTTNGVWSKNYHQWTFASEVTKYNPYGVEVENKDALNRYSSAQYGYSYKLPTAVASNAAYKEMGFDGFEDYFYSNQNTPSVLRPHFGFQQHVSVNASVSSKASHTGRKSLEIKPNQSIIFERKINACDTTIVLPPM